MWQLPKLQDRPSSGITCCSKETGSEPASSANAAHSGLPLLASLRGAVSAAFCPLSSAPQLTDKSTRIAPVLRARPLRAHSVRQMEPMTGQYTLLARGSAEQSQPALDAREASRDPLSMSRTAQRFAGFALLAGACSSGVPLPAVDSEEVVPGETPADSCRDSAASCEAFGDERPSRLSEH